MSHPMPDLDQRYYYEDKDRHKNVRRYFRKRLPNSTKFRKVRLREEPGTPEFLEEFAAAMVGRPYVRKNVETKPVVVKVVDKSLRWLITRYYRECAEFRAYDEETKKTRRRILKAICKEPTSATDKSEIGDRPCDIPQDKIEIIISTARPRRRSIRRTHG